MKLNSTNIEFISNKVAIDLNKSQAITMTSGLDVIKAVVQNILEENSKIEAQIDELAYNIIEENLDEIDFYQANEKELFWMIKRKIAQEQNFALNFDDRYSTISFNILKKLYNEDLINYHTSDNFVKNVIYTAIREYLNNYNQIEKSVIEKIDQQHPQVVHGSDEYQILFEKYYMQELLKWGYLE